VLKPQENMRGRAGTAIDTGTNAAPAERGGRTPARRAGLLVAGRSVRLPAALIVALVCVFAGLRTAHAQSTSGTSGISTALTPLSSPKGLISMVPNANGVQRKFEYYTPSRPWWISFSDCVLGDEFTFALTVRDTSNPLEIWAGTENCAISRSRTDRGQCWIVARQSQLSDNVHVTVPVRDIVARRLNTVDPPTGVGADVCDDNTDPSGEAITFYFMLVDGGQGDEYFAWDGGTGGTGFDVVGPDPPKSISVGVGENQLAISIGGVSEETDRERFEAFCVPAGTTRASLGLDAGTNGELLADGGVSGAGSVNDAGISTGAAPAACYTDLMVAGVRPPPGYSCGTANEVSSTLRTSHLANYQTYAVAVAGQDNLGNAGVASDIQCGTPVELNDFYENYVRAGGKGGGGFCSFAPPEPRSLGRGLGVIVLLLAGFGVRRRRSIS
jgi:hypothetical protein